MPTFTKATREVVDYQPAMAREDAFVDGGVLEQRWAKGLRDKVVSVPTARSCGDEAEGLG